MCLAQSADDEDDTDFWLATPGFRESLIEAEADIAAGRTYSAEEVRARFGLAFGGKLADRSRFFKSETPNGRLNPFHCSYSFDSS